MRITVQGPVRVAGHPGSEAGGGGSAQEIGSQHVQRPHDAAQGLPGGPAYRGETLGDLVRGGPWSLAAGCLHV